MASILEVDQDEQQQQQHSHISCSRSGYCSRTGVYRSLFQLQGPRHRVPTEPNLDVPTFLFSQLPPPHIAKTKPALVDSATGHGLTYSQLRHRALSLAAALHHGLGLPKGDVVLLLLSPNSTLYPVICLGVLAAGAVITTANPLGSAAEVAKQVSDSGATLAISAPEQAHKLHSTGIPTLITARDTTPPTVPLLSVEELIEGADPTDAPLLATQQSDAAAVLYSSGTSGASKGAVMTHGNLISMMALVSWSAEASSSGEDVFLAFLPVSHAYGLAFFALGLLCVGTATTVVMSTPRFDLEAAMEAVQRHQVSNMLAVPPAVLVAMSKNVMNSRWNLQSLRRVGTGGAPMGALVGREFRRRFPWVELRVGYGTTEACGPVTVSASEAETRTRTGCSGQLMPGFEAKIVEAGTAGAAPLGPGGVGELWLKGPTIMKAAAETLPVEGEHQGWLRTGDLAYFDQDGYLYIVDRIDELIKHNGYQVAPAEIEEILATHPHILDAAVGPVADEQAGQIPVAYVVKSANSSLTSEEIIQFVAAKVAPYKRIKRVSFVNAIPRSAAGKILRKQLVAQKQQDISSKL